jgi:hypothetical protein
LRYLPGAILVVDTPGLKVMQYRHIEGQVALPTMTPALFLAAARALQQLHNEGIIHGDVRLFNLVVDPDQGTATWIDFDFSVDVKVALRPGYPSGWQRNIPDGERHPDANPDRPLELAHDVFAFRALLKLYLRSGEADPIPTASLSDIISWLERQPAQQWSLQKRFSRSDGTGSPP